MKAFALLALTFSSLAQAASTQRLALLVGNNVGGDLAALHYAEEDASKMARVLSELGGVAPDDLTLLRGGTVADLSRAFAGIQERVAAAHRSHGARTMLIFYFSGHSDGEALELGTERFPFTVLRERLTASGADVQVAIVDSCRSGAMLAFKGGKPGPAFDIRLNDDLPNQGMALLTSSAATEDALESKEIRGSYFTSNLVSGLRGAADSSGDGKVTLGEAYRYAYAHTVASTADTIVGPQHPGYAYRLTGMGEIVLTDLAPSSASLLLPGGFERALVADAARNEVLAEFPQGAPQRLALAAGDYRVQLWRGGRGFTTRMALKDGEQRTMAWSDLKPLPTAQVLAQAKGGSGGPMGKALDHAIGRFHDFDDKGANQELQLIVQSDPPPWAGAKAHLYLGIIAVNALNEPVARAEFHKALLTQAMVELPADSSPKADLIFKMAFADVQRELQHEVSATQELPLVPVAADAAVPLTPVIVGEEQAKPESKSSSHVVSFVLVGAAAVAAAVAVYGGVQVVNYQGMASQTPAPSIKAYTSAQSSAQAWQYGWVGAAGLGLALAGTAVFTW